MPIYRYNFFLNKRLENCEQWLRNNTISKDLYMLLFVEAIAEPELCTTNDFSEVYIYWNSCTSEDQYNFYHQIEIGV